MLFRKRTWKKRVWFKSGLGSIHRLGVSAGVTLGGGEGRKSIKEKELKDKDRWFFRWKVSWVGGGWNGLRMETAKVAPSQNWKCQYSLGKKRKEKLNPSSWQPGVSQTPAQLLALRFFPPAGKQLPCCKGRCTGTCSKSRRLSGQGSCLSKGCVRSPESPASLHSERQKLLERVINSSVKH